MDLVISLLLLILFSPLLVGVAGVVWLTMGRPVLFAHRRAGLHGRPFTLWKFRTMTMEVDADGRLLPDEQRLTPVGRFLRRTSLDELPQLINVLRGEMSLVGPRPLPVEYLPRFTPEQAVRHEVKPGITGWALVQGRNWLPWEERLHLDAWYARHWTLGLDIKILVKTVWKVLKQEGINYPGHATMPPFEGKGR
ncbi:MAG: sugar transferase [Candidatus Bipolaricaulota bacterium]|nr:sugar transferase [Candidatus Bipolaricaulota bacterium]